MRVTLLDVEARLVATVEVAADLEALAALRQRGAEEIRGLVPDVLLHNGRVYRLSAGLTYREATVSVTAGAPVLGPGAVPAPGLRPTGLAHRELRVRLEDAERTLETATGVFDKDIHLPGGQPGSPATGVGQLRALVTERDALWAENGLLLHALGLMEAVAGHQTDARRHPLTCGNDSSHQPLVPRWSPSIRWVVLTCAMCDYEQSWVPDVVRHWRPERGGG